MNACVYFFAVFCICAACANGQSIGELAKAGGKANTGISAGAIKAANTPAESLDSIISKASAGDANAQLALGSYYARGERGLPADAAKAVEWLEKSANGGEKAAMAYLGYIYGEGKLVKRDMQKAVKWREAAAKIGDANDKWSLGNAFLYGFLVPKDQMKALHWITLSAEEGNADAVVKLIEIHTNLKNGAELEKWNTVFAKMQLDAANKGNAVAMVAVADKLMSGNKGLPRNRIQAIYWYKKAADAGNAEAIDKVAKMYAKGRFLPKNPEKAQEYFEKLANTDPSYCFKISAFYGEGKDGFPQDETKSLEWYARGAQNSDVTTKMYLIFKYWKAGDTKNAVKWCNDVIEDTQKNIGALGEQANDTKNVQANMLKQTLQTAKSMLSDISNGRDAPADPNAYFNMLSNRH